MQQNKQFLAFFQQSEKKPEQLKIGVECELFGFFQTTFERVPFHIISKILLDFINQDQWDATYEDDKIIALKKENSTITLEPGGQLELSLAPFYSIHEIAGHIQSFLDNLKKYSQEHQVFWLSVGYDPFTPLDKIPWMPKKRYQVMKEYLKPLGDETWNMMKGTCGFQCNFDYLSENDMIKKMKITSFLSPLFTALFANSPVEESTITSYQSLRQKRWIHFDPKRKGIVEAVFHKDFSYQKYIEHILSVPMMILHRSNTIIDMRGIDFLEFEKNGHQDIQFEEKDWETHLSTVFPHSRLKNTIETRTSDASSFEMNLANIALWKGMIYDQTTLNQAFELVLSIDKNIIKQFDQRVVKEGLTLEVASFSMQSLAEKVVALSEQGLRNLDSSEIDYLEPIKKIIKDKKTDSDKIIKTCQSASNKDFLDIYKKLSCVYA